MQHMISQASQKLDTKKQHINAKNVSLAQVAIRERSPSYIGNKLVSTVAKQTETPEVNEDKVASRTEQEEVQAEMNMHVL